MINFNHVITTRGCIGKCTYCSTDLRRKTIRFISPKKILEEMELLYALYGMDYIFIQDDTFAINEQRFIDFCSLKEKSAVCNLHWRCFIRLDQINERIVAAAKSAYCSLMSVGLEFISPVSQQKTNKYNRIFTISDIIERINIIKNNNIQVHISLLFGFPWETTRDYIELLEFVRKYGYLFNGIVANLVMPMPGTELYNSYHKEYNFTNWWLKEDARVSTTRDPFFYRLGNWIDAYRYNYFKYTKKDICLFNQIFSQIELNNLQKFKYKKILVALSNLSRQVFYKSPKIENYFFPEKISDTIFKLLYR